MSFPPLPDPHAIAVMLLTLVALALFMREKIPLETSSMIVIVALVLGFEVFPYVSPQGKALRAVEFFHGFGHEALIAVSALMVLGHGLVRTGALEPLGGALARFWRVQPTFSLLLTLILVALLSAFINNTPIVVLMIPVLISVSTRSKSSPSAVLMPMGMATVLGGTATTIGTSTNLLVVSLAADMGLRRIGMFDFVVPGAIAAGIGILFLWLIAPRLLPRRTTPLSNASPRIFTAHLRIPEGSFADGRKLSEAVTKVGGELKVMRIERGDGMYVTPFPDARLRAGDRLLVTDRPSNLKHFEQALGATLYSGDTRVDEDHPLSASDQQISEIVVVDGSPIAGETLKTLRFIQRYQLVVLALHRAGKPIATIGKVMGDVALQPGDVLLVQGPAEQITALRQDARMLVLDATADLPDTRKSPAAVMITIAVILTAALGVAPISISALIGVLLLVITRCLKWHEVAGALSTTVILIVVASLGLGIALLRTGAADFIAQTFVATTFGAPPLVVLSGFMLLLAVLTSVVSNNATAMIGTPIAISMAQLLGQPPEAFVLAVIFGANLCYATPFAYKTNLLVMAAGGYTFGDFLRVGVPLVIIMWLSYTGLLGYFYGI
ncbi:MAG: SLC13 family permease [Burkholderiaceae bacterium]|nr:SLC13 family permease [Burkholderiaceae bacterium]